MIHPQARHESRQKALEEWRILKQVLKDAQHPHIADPTSGEYLFSPVRGVEKVEKVDEEDKNTPDNWIARHPALIRLTGPHPLNAEPPTNLLMNHGLITPSSLHYVRNHGTVPKLSWDTHRVSVEGMVPKPRSFTMDELKSLPSIKIPVTFACDGNRRKELNMIKHTRGFNWGPGAVGTAVWKGARLSEVLQMCGLPEKDSKANYVWFEGADKLPNGHYGTSIPLYRALEHTNDIMLAYEMNDEPLAPDHGFPVRIIIPGFVGGRNVKWLTRIVVSDTESDSHYHYEDNRVLPSDVDFYTADMGRWWYKPDYVLYELNVNSVITSPHHEECVSVDNTSSDNKLMVKGYAYAGGGRKVTRVEVSLDGGKMWDQCKLRFPANPQRHGYKHWVWCHWEYEMPSWKLLHCDEIVVRAWDSAQNTQPEHPTWNVLGMMNNCWYRINVDAKQPSTKNTPNVWFRHPVLPGPQWGGWMMKTLLASKLPDDKEPKPALVVPSAPEAAVRAGKHVTMAEVSKHNKEDDCWIVIDREVYDVTHYMSSHPGGGAPFVIYGGKDASLVFHEIHAVDAWEIKNRYCIGFVVSDEFIPKDLAEERTKNYLLGPTKGWLSSTLIDIKQISHDTKIFKYKLEGDKHQEAMKLGLPIGQHVLLGAKVNDQFVVRPYTPIGPIGDIGDDGILTLLVKLYRSHGDKPGGLFTQYMDKLQIGDTSVKIRGPTGHVLYHGHGVFTLHTTTIHVDKVSLIAGGTGITPLYQILYAILKNPDDKTQVALLYSNNTTEDILLRVELDQLAKEHPDQFKLWYTVSKAPDDGRWSYSVGLVDEKMMKDHVFWPSEDSLIFICGPPLMIEKGTVPHLVSMGYTEDIMIEF